MSKQLTLVVTKQWFDMVADGVKKEEYREIKYFWETRLLSKIRGREVPPHFKKYDTIRYCHAYASDRREMIIECKGITIGEPKAEWAGGMKGDHFIIHLGAILSKNF